MWKVSRPPLRGRGLQRLKTFFVCAVMSVVTFIPGKYFPGSGVTVDRPFVTELGAVSRRAGEDVVVLSPAPRIQVLGSVTDRDRVAQADGNGQRTCFGVRPQKHRCKFNVFGREFVVTWYGAVQNLDVEVNSQVSCGGSAVVNPSRYHLPPHDLFCRHIYVRSEVGTQVVYKGALKMRDDFGALLRSPGGNYRSIGGSPCRQESQKQQASFYADNYILAARKAVLNLGELQKALSRDRHASLGVEIGLGSIFGALSAFFGFSGVALCVRGCVNNDAKRLHLGAALILSALGTLGLSVCWALGMFGSG